MEMHHLTLFKLDIQLSHTSINGTKFCIRSVEFSIIVLCLNSQNITYQIKQHCELMIYIVLIRYQNDFKTMESTSCKHLYDFSCIVNLPTIILLTDS